MTGTGLRVGLVCPYSLDAPGGVQNHVLGLARHLLEEGHHPRVLAPGQPAGLPSGLAGLVTSTGGTVPVPYNGSVARVAFGPRTHARVRRWLADGEFDLVHLHEPVTPSAAFWALRAARSPVVATFHTATPRSRAMALAGGVLRRTVDRIDAGMAVSEPARRVVREHLGREVGVVPNGFRFADVAAPVRPVGAWRGGERPRLVFLGRVEEPRKGLAVLLAALPELRRRWPGLEVVVAGQGRCRLPSWVRREASVDDASKAALLASADVFVAPHTARESFGIVLLEAMAAGAPVVASALPAFVELLRAGRPVGWVSGGSGERGPLGAVVPVGDPAALAAAVDQTLRQPPWARAERARQHARSFDWSRVGPAVVEVYRTVGRASDTPFALAARSGRASNLSG